MREVWLFSSRGLEGINDGDLPVPWVRVRIFGELARLCAYSEATNVSALAVDARDAAPEVFAAISRGATWLPVVVICEVSDLVKLVATFETISETRRSLFAELVHRSRTGIFVHLDGRLVFANDRLLEMFGYDDSWKTRPLGDLPPFFSHIHPDDRRLIESRFKARLRGETQPEQYLVRLVDHQGRAFWAEMAVTTLQSDAELFVMGNLVDVTARMEAEECLRKSQKSYRELFENASDVIAIIDETGVCHEVNQRVFEVFGLRPEEIIGKSLFSILERIQLDPLSIMPQFQKAMTTGMPQEVVELSCTRADGRPLFIDLNTCYFGIEGEGSRGVMVNIRDNTRRQLDARAIREERDFNDAILNSVDVLIFATSPGGHALVFNRACEEVSGYRFQELCERPFWEVLVEAEAQEIERARLAELTQYGCAVAFENSWIGKNGERHFLRWHATRLNHEDGSARFLLATGIDITEVRRAQSDSERLNTQLQQAQKMEAIGRLAGGVAHDFNNLLMAIKGNIALSEMEPLCAETQNRALHEINKAADRAAKLTRQLLDFSRQQIVTPHEIDLGSLINESYSLLERVVGEDVTLFVSTEADLPAVKADPGQIEQILVNLVVNARDAMPQGGRITITAHSVFLSASDLGGILPRNRYVRIKVEDTGFGMDEATLRRVFEPYFTTKPRGKGSGLGLSVVYSAVKQNGGLIEAASQAGEGSCFTIHLPAIERRGKPRDAMRRLGEMPRGQETLLVVEDEDIVREVLVRSLSRLGYRALEAESGETALMLAEKEGYAIDLLLTDIVMPGLSGSDLASQLKPFFARLPIIYTSGYTNEAIVNHGVELDSVHFIAKPYAIPELAHKIRGVLDARP